MRDIAFVPDKNRKLFWAHIIVPDNYRNRMRNIAFVPDKNRKLFWAHIIVPDNYSNRMRNIAFVPDNDMQTGLNNSFYFVTIYIYSSPEAALKKVFYSHRRKEMIHFSLKNDLI